MGHGTVLKWKIRQGDTTISNSKARKGNWHHAKGPLNRADTGIFKKGGGGGGGGGGGVRAIVKLLVVSSGPRCFTFKNSKLYRNWEGVPPPPTPVIPHLFNEV